MCNCNNHSTNKTKWVPFDLARAKAGEPFYREHDKATPIAWHYWENVENNHMPLHVFFADDDGDPSTYTKEGYFYSSREDSSNNLVMKTHTHTRWIAVRKGLANAPSLLVTNAFLSKITALSGISDPLLYDLIEIEVSNN